MHTVHKHIHNIYVVLKCWGAVKKSLKKLLRGSIMGKKKLTNSVLEQWQIPQKAEDNNGN